MVKYNSTEQATLHAVFTASVEGKGDVPVLNVDTTLDTNTFTFNITQTVLDLETYKANAAELKAQYSAYKDTIIKKAQDMGYVQF